MTSVIWLTETGEEKLTLAEVMEYRVKDECVSIFNINGTMKKVHKSKMVEKLHTEPMEAVPDKSDKYIALVDMGFLWRLATPSAEDCETTSGFYDELPFQFIHTMDLSLVDTTLHDSPLVL